MNSETLKFWMLLGFVISVSGCGVTKQNKQHSGYMLQSYKATNDLGTIQPAAGALQNLNLGREALNLAPQKSCSFSSFHRKNTIGYEFDNRRQLGFNIKPSFDVFDPSDADVEFGLRFTMALGGAANKRPKCTYGSGYYGLLPYAMNDKINLSGVMNKNNIKSYIKEKLEIREQRRQEREAKRRGS